MIYTVTLNPTIDRTIHYPELRVGELNRATSSRTDLSGKGVNVSVALRRLGVNSVIIGLRGGVPGEILQKGLEEMGYRCEFVAVEGETRSNITVIDDRHGVTTKLNEAGPTVQEPDLDALEDLLLQRTDPGDVVVFSGSLPPGAPDDTYARLIRGLKVRDVVTVLDTSGPAMVAGSKARPDFVKPNDIEAEEMTGRSFDTERERDLAAGIAALLDMGPRRVLLSLGSRGAIYADSETVQWARPPRIQEISAVGAGDASTAGALWAWLERHDAPEIARWAVASGTAAAMTDGTFFPDRAAIERVYDQVTVTAL
jgi:1-phosphofructokinase family hexose kinase